DRGDDREPEHQLVQGDGDQVELAAGQWWTSVEAVVPRAPEAAAPVVEGAVERRAHVGLPRVEVHAGERVGKGRGVIRPRHERTGEVPPKGSRPRPPQRRATAPAAEGAEARRDENGDVAREDAPPDVGSVL